MIQRIQSIYLLLTTILSLLFLKGSILNFSGNSGSIVKLTLTGLFRNSGSQSFELLTTLLPVSAVMILVPLISFITLVLFKKRKLQLILAISTVLLSAGSIILLGCLSWFISSKYDVSIVLRFKILLPLIVMILTILAYRGIRKDDRLLKSYDRLR